MTELNNRQKEILMFLKKFNEPITAKWMSKELGVSDRTIRNEINKLQKECESFGIEIESTRGKGYQLKVINKALLKNESHLLFKKNDSLSDRFVLQDNRVKYILQRLLLAKDFIKMERLEDELFVSKSTLQNDLKLVEKKLKQFRLTYVNRPYYGKKVHGDEYMKRLCLSNSALENNKGFSNERDWFRLLDFNLFVKIKVIIIEIVDDYNFDISDLTLESLATHITIACKRIEDDFIIGPLNVPLTDGSTIERNVADKIIQEVENFTGLKFPQTEVEYILVHLLGTKLSYEIDSSESNILSEIVEGIVEKLKEVYNWDFSYDLEFIRGLSFHLGPVMNRLRYGMNIHNPLLNDIKAKYPLAFEGAVVASKCIGKYINKEIGEHEISYVAMYIGAALERMQITQKNRVLIVCATGVGSAKLLYFHLKKLFEDEMEIMDTISYYKLSSYPLDDIDFIISTIPVEMEFNVPVIVVNPLLVDEDIKNIKYQFNVFQDKDLTFIDPSRVFIHQELKDRESVIRFLCNKLNEQEIVSKDYVELVLKREALSSTYFGNLVAIPHPIITQTNKTLWTICTLKYPIPWIDQNMVQFVCLLNVKEDSSEDLSNMYERLIALIKSNSVIQQLITSNSTEELIEILSEPIQQ